MADRGDLPGTPERRRALDARYGALAAGSGSLSCGGALDVAAPRAGETVVDLGCGRGGDVLRAAVLVGPLGLAVGVDANAPMLSVARERAGDLPRARFVRGDLAAVPLAARCADVVISDCAVNHAPDKAAVYREIHRLLRPGGRFAVSDVVAERELPEEVRRDPAAWAGCYGGAIPEPEYLEAVARGGLRELRVVRRTAPYERGGVRVLSLTIEGRRPRGPRPRDRMRLSRSAILAPVSASERVLLVQPLSGQAALLGGAEAEALRRLEAGGALPPSLAEDVLREARFVVESDEEDEALRASAIARWSAEAARSPTQLVVVPSFGCNLACTYCYQEPFHPSGAGLVSPEGVDAFFAYVDRYHAAEEPRPYLTLFGGEPLLDTPAHHDRVARYLSGAGERGLEVAVVTNGHDLAAYLPALGAGPVREVQVTLDGPRSVHDRRRPLAGGGGTFDRIVAGIDGLVRAGIPVSLRVVADRENLPALPELADLAAAKGWLDLPAARFRTQVGRNYELFGCARRQRPDALLDRVALWARWLELAEAHPVLRRFHAPRFHGLGHLAKEGELPAPNFDACPATKKEWAFGPDGRLYGCTATVGHPAHVLGRYHPDAARDEGAIAIWRGRSALTIPECRRCVLAPVCGGGCGAVAWARTGRALAPDCRPVVELYGLGARYHRLGE